MIALHDALTARVLLLDNMGFIFLFGTLRIVAIWDCGRTSEYPLIKRNRNSGQFGSLFAGNFRLRFVLYVLNCRPRKPLSGHAPGNLRPDSAALLG